MKIRVASVEDAAELTALARRSKASWGYPDEWLREWEPELTLSAEYIAGNGVLVAELDGKAVGVVAVGHEPDGPEVHHLWVDPEHQRRGIGRDLLDRALEVARERGWTALRIVSDPYALPFYLGRGAVRVGIVPAPVAGTERILPLLRLIVP